MDGCDRSFAQLSNLNHHKKNHEEHVKRDVSRQYRCEVCDRSYATNQSLHTHKQKVSHSDPFELFYGTLFHYLYIFTRYQYKQLYIKTKREVHSIHSYFVSILLEPFVTEDQCCKTKVFIKMF